MPKNNISFKSVQQFLDERFVKYVARVCDEHEIDLAKTPIKRVSIAIATDADGSVYRIPDEGQKRVRVGRMANEPAIQDDDFGILSTTRDVDRDNEVIMPRGVDMSEWRKSGGILGNHDYGTLPIAKAVWAGVDDYAVKLHIRPAGTTAGEELRILSKFMPLTASIGFIPLDKIGQHSPDFEKTIAKMQADWPEFKADPASVSGIIRKSIKLETSIVSVPANPNAVQDQLEKCLSAGTLKESEAQVVLKHLKEIQLADIITRDDAGDKVYEIRFKGAAQPTSKAVIPYSIHGAGPKQPVDKDWNGSQETSAADVDELVIMSAWFDNDNTDIKASYKLTHHAAEGKHAVNFRAVSSAMGALLGASGGVEIPAGDRQGVYDHLARHYRDFDREAPEFRSWDEAELKQKLDADLESAGRTVKLISKPQEKRSVVRLIASPRSISLMQDDPNDVKTIVKTEVDRRKGRI